MYVVGWCSFTNSVYGCEVKSRKERRDSTSSLPSLGRTLYKQVSIRFCTSTFLITILQQYECSYEAPCLHLQLDEVAKSTLRRRLTHILPSLRDCTSGSPDLSVSNPLVVRDSSKSHLAHADRSDSKPVRTLIPLILQCIRYRISRCPIRFVLLSH